MDFEFSEEQEELRKKVRKFLKKEMTPKVFEEIETIGDTWGAHHPELYRKLGEEGWFGYHWPVEYGGRGGDLMDLAIIEEEMGYFEVPMSSYSTTVKVAGNTIMTFGTEEQKRFFLPRIARGRLVICQGFTEPNAGTDLASLSTRAEEDGESFIINGQKIFTSNAHVADFILLLARTDPNAPKHKGLSLFLIPMRTKGITLHPIRTMAGGRLNQIFFEDVKIQKDFLLGQKNQGWYHASWTLNSERAMIAVIGRCRRILDDLVSYVKRRPLSKHPLIRQKLAQMEIEVRVARLMAYRVASLQTKGIMSAHVTSMSKVLAGETMQRLVNNALQILGPRAILKKGSKRTILYGKIEAMYMRAPSFNIAAGTNEIQRVLIAQKHLGLPR